MTTIANAPLVAHHGRGSGSRLSRCRCRPTRASRKACAASPVLRLTRIRTGGVHAFTRTAVGGIRTPGVVIAVMNGVDVLVRTGPLAGRVIDKLCRATAQRDAATVSTLRLRSAEPAGADAPQVAIDAFERRGVEQVRQLDVAGGEVRVGTDVGYMTAFDPHQTS